jgi:hypothetical protein
MLIKSFESFVTAAGRLFTNWRTLLSIAALYAALLAALYMFVSIKEATLAQVSLTLLLALSAPLLFFLLQTATAGYTTEPHASQLIKKSVRDCWKLALISIPVVALLFVAAYYLNKAQIRLANPTIASTAPVFAVPQAAPKQPIRWGLVAIMGLRYFLLAVVGPLVLLQLWISVAQTGLVATVKHLWSRLASAIAPQSVLIYSIGFLVFALLPYFILFKTTTTNRAWLEVSLLAGRLAAVFLLTLLGWLITAGALAIATTQPKETVTVAEA